LRQIVYLYEAASVKGLWEECGLSLYDTDSEWRAFV
jgi:hypothetical protein